MSHTYEPVCGQDGLTYFSPCRAGCTSTVIDGVRVYAILLLYLFWCLLCSLTHLLIVPVCLVISIQRWLLLLTVFVRVIVLL